MSGRENRCGLCETVSMGSWLFIAVGAFFAALAENAVFQESFTYLMLTGFAIQAAAGIKGIINNLWWG